MNKLTLASHIGEIYQSGGNIIEYLRSLDGSRANTVEDIKISYDFQAGSYISSYKKNPGYLESYTEAIAEVFSKLGCFQTCLEVGCGEATTLALLAGKLGPKTFGGFDISWSRIKYGQQFCQQRGLDPSLFCADLFNIPLESGSVDVVYTSHSIEPNGGREAEAITELVRVARKWVVLLEPAYEFAEAEAKSRMEKHGYVKNIAKTISELGFKLVRSEPFPISSNPLNPTGLYLIDVNADAGSQVDFKYRCPVAHVCMQPFKDVFFARESMLAYPVLDGVPYLLASHAVLASKYQKK